MSLTQEQLRNGKKWVAALRSGKYKQGTERLKRDEGEGEQYCCLGVACDLSGLGEWFVSGEVDQRLKWRTTDGLVQVSSYPPEEVADMFGMPGTDPFVGDWYLTKFNDAGGTFNQIADLLEDALYNKFADLKEEEPH